MKSMLAASFVPVTSTRLGYVAILSRAPLSCRLCTFRHRGYCVPMRRRLFSHCPPIMPSSAKVVSIPNLKSLAFQPLDFKTLRRVSLACRSCHWLDCGTRLMDQSNMMWRRRAHFLCQRLSHWDGLQPYSDQNTSRSNLICWYVKSSWMIPMYLQIVALFTAGEGNHNFHVR
ncbi:hypothetical protein BGW80DRAFT_161355 [Lactifluus volemus]|nr:hypothetical protein BGW80DRAFT_161355 [Lactifluus volemus]